MGNSKNCSASNPCLICGKPDWCNIVTHPNGDVLAYCHRVHGDKGETTIAGGVTYIAKKQTESGFTVWEPYEQYEANRRAWLAQKYPNGYKGGNNSYKKMAPKAMVVNSPASKIGELLPGQTKVAEPTRLDEVYRALLDILVLEDKHEAKLRAEWDATPGVYESIMQSYPIRSLPPEDQLRFSSKERLNNPSRKKVMEELISRVGTPEGVPGFYERNDGAWTMHPICGIIFPVYDTDGRIIRIRIGVDYPMVKGNLGGAEGHFMYTSINKSAGWYFIPDGSRNAELVWQYDGGNANLITLNKKGYPEGKISAKYMNFTSFKEVERPLEDHSAGYVNKFNKGAESGSWCSFYTSDGDDPTFVYITEGEKKAIVANTILHVPTICIPGVNSFMKLFQEQPGIGLSIIDSLIGKGTKGFVLVFDADKGVNESVLYYEKSAVEEFKKRGLLIALGEWNASWGKGLDDVLLAGVMPDVHLVD